MRKIYFIFKRLGFPKVFICLFQKIYYLALSKIFKFDVWHASAPFSCRPYKSEVVDLVNSLKSTSVIEVGCGLGDIISRINCSKCYGVDKDSNVINAARKINGNVRYFVSDIGSVQRVIDCNETIELLIMVNWPHGVEWKNLSSSVLSIHG